MGTRRAAAFIVSGLFEMDCLGLRWSPEMGVVSSECDAPLVRV
jgi:hypothetical protein